MEFERRFIDAERDGQLWAAPPGEQNNLITGYGSVFNQVSEVMWGFVEQVAPGAWNGVFGDDVRSLWNHSSLYVMGRTTNGTLRLSSDSYGLRYENEPPNPAECGFGKDFLYSLRRGDVTQKSVGFRVGEDDWSQRDDGIWVRTVVSVEKLHELSYCTIPAFSQTTVEMRNLLGFEPKIPDSLESALRSVRAAANCAAGRTVRVAAGSCPLRSHRRRRSASSRSVYPASRDRLVTAGAGSVRVHRNRAASFRYRCG